MRLVQHCEPTLLAISTFVLLFALSAFAGILVVLPQAPPVQAASPPQAPTIIQTQSFNFKIVTHLVQNTTGCIGNQGCYTYVTPSGNHSFSKALPWLEKDTSLWKNATTTFHAYGIIETLILVPSAPVVSAGATLYSVNTTQKTLVGGIIHGYLFVSYDFSKTPPKESVKYREATGVTTSFNILEGVASSAFPYLSTDGTTYLATSGLLNTKSGSYSHAFLSSTSTGAGKFSVSLDWSDYGSASVLYGQFVFNGVTYQGVLVKFPLNVASVDPSVVQTNNCNTTTTCTFPSNVGANNLILVFTWFSGTGNTISDSQSNSYTTTKADLTITGSSYHISYYWAKAGSTGADTITLSQTTNAIQITEYSGLLATASKGSSFDSGTGTATDVTSFTPSAAAYVIVLVGYNSGGSFTAGSGYTIIATNILNSGGSDEISNSAISSATTAPATLGTSQGWAEIADSFASATVTQPILVATPTGGSVFTYTLSGCSVSITSATSGTTINPTATPSCSSITLTMPAAGASTRYVFASSASTTTVVTCASGTCTTFQPADYYQLLYTLSYSVTGGGTPTAPILTSTQAGASYTPALTTTATGYWLDYGATCSTTNPTTGSTSTERWDTNTACPTVSTAQTIVFAYYHQYAQTASYSGTVATGGAPSLACQRFGSASSDILATTSASIWEDNSCAFTISKPTADFPSASHRYETNYANGTVASASTIAPAFYEQFACTCSYSGTVATGGAPSFSRTLFGAASTATALTTTAATLWGDNSGAYSITKPTADFPSATERYQTNTANGTVSAAFTLAPAFYHQWKITPILVIAATSIAISPAASASTISCTQFGATSSGCSGNWVDSGGIAYAGSVTWETIQVGDSTDTTTITAGGNANLATYVYGQDSNLIEFGVDSGTLSAPGWNPAVNQLSFTGTCSSAHLCIVYPSAGSGFGSPYYVSAGGIVYAQGSGWTWSSGSYVSITVGTAVQVITSWTPQSNPPVGGGNTGGTIITQQTTTVTTTSIAPAAPVPISNTVTTVQATGAQYLIALIIAAIGLGLSVAAVRNSRTWVKVAVGALWAYIMADVFLYLSGFGIPLSTVGVSVGASWFPSWLPFPDLTSLGTPIAQGLVSASFLPLTITLLGGGALIGVLYQQGLFEENFE